MTKAELLGEVRRLDRRLKRVEGVLARERESVERQVEAVRRDANRQLTAMMQEIAQLRHHEARTAALERLLAERESAESPEP